MRGKATLIALCLLALMVPARRAAAVEAVPGDSCTGNPTNSWIWAGAPENGGVLNGMYCNTNWLGVINFQSSGNVGIGTTSPGGTLNVFNSATNTTSLLVKGASDAGTYKNQRIVDFQRWDGHSMFSINTAGSENWGKVTTDNINVLYQLGVGYDVGAGAGTTATFAVNGTVGIGNQAPGAKLDLGLAGTTLGTLRLEGNTSGYVQIQPAAAAGSWTATLPATAGTSGYVLSTDGAGVLSWAAAGSGGPLSGITAAVGNQAGIANGAYTIVWNWDTLAGGSALKLASTSTAAAGNAQKMLEIALSGANGTTTQTTYDAYFANTHTGTSSTNVGLYASASGGTNNYAAIFAAGNVGIGTATPTNNLSFTGQSAQTIWMERQTTANTAGNNLTIQASGATSGATDKAGGNLILSVGTVTGNALNYVSLKAAGSFGNASGTTDYAPQEWLRVGPNYVSLVTNGSTAGNALMFNAYVVNGGVDTYINNGSSFEIWHDDNNHVLEFDAAASGTAGNSIAYTPAIIIKSDGKVRIGSSTAPSYALDVTGQVRISSFAAASATTVCSNAGVLSTCSSSIRYKEKVKDAPFGLKDVMLMRPVTFKWKGRDEKDLGFIAEEMEKVNPLFVNYERGQIEGVKYPQLTAVLANAIKEQQAEIEELRAEIAALKAQRARH